MLYYFNKTTISNNRIVDDFSNITQTINELQKSRNKINDTLNCSVHRQSIANLEITMIEIARVSKCHLAILEGYFEKISPFIVWLLLHQIFNRRASITSFLQYDPILQWHCGRMAESWVLECVSTTNVLQNLPSQITQTLWAVKPLRKPRAAPQFSITWLNLATLKCVERWMHTAWDLTTAFIRSIASLTLT